ncbi:MAG: FadR/GntR family transcriptional regulator [Candidatus Bipolaricaulia bacterium]
MFKTLSSRRLSDDAVRQIKQLIKEGTLSIGDKLPSERQLVRELGTSRVPVREALRMLEAQGLIEVHPGKGAFVVGSPDEAESVAHLKRWFWENRDRVLDLLEVRGAVEQEAAYLAARRADEQDIERLRSILERTDQAIERGDIKAIVKNDQMFHIAISRASKNEFFPTLAEQLIDALYESRKSLLELPGLPASSIHEHYQIFYAIRERDPQEAKVALLNHLERVKQAIKNLRN